MIKYLKKLLLPLLVLIVAVACSDRNGKYIAFHDNGNTWIEANYINDHLDGPFKTYYPDGQEEVSANFSDDNITGQIEKRNKNGRIILSCVIDDEGLLNGPVKISYPDGLDNFNETYEKGKPLGDFIMWYSPG